MLIMNVQSINHLKKDQVMFEDDNRFVKFSQMQKNIEQGRRRRNLIFNAESELVAASQNRNS